MALYQYCILLFLIFKLLLLPGVPGGYVMPPSQPAGPRFTEEDVKQIQEMFPDTDTDVVRSLLETNMGNKDMTINNLLAMQT